MHRSATIGNKVYNLKTLPDGSIKVHEVDVSSFPSDPGQSAFNEDRHLQIDIDNDMEHPKRNVQSNNVIDIMCLYTPEALCDESGQDADCDTTNERSIDMMDDKCELAIEETNTAFRESGVTATANLVYKGLISNFTEERYMCSALSKMRYNTESHYKEVRDLKTQYGADLVTLLTKQILYDYDRKQTDDKRLCGCGDMFADHPLAAFSVVDKSCATGYYSVAHEIGKSSIQNYSICFLSTSCESVPYNLCYSNSQGIIWDVSIRLDPLTQTLRMGSSTQNQTLELSWLTIVQIKIVKEFFVFRQQTKSTDGKGRNLAHRLITVQLNSIRTVLQLQTIWRARTQSRSQHR